MDTLLAETRQRANGKSREEIIERVRTCERKGFVRQASNAKRHECLPVTYQRVRWRTNQQRAFRASFGKERERCIFRALRMVPATITRTNQTVRKEHFYLAAVLRYERRKVAMSLPFARWKNAAWAGGRIALCLFLTKDGGRRRGNRHGLRAKGKLGRQRVGIASPRSQTSGRWVECRTVGALAVRIKVLGTVCARGLSIEARMRLNQMVRVSSRLQK